MVISAAVYVLPQRWTQSPRFVAVKLFSPLLDIGPDAPKTAADAPSENASQADYLQLWADYQNLQARYDALVEQYQQLARVRSQLPITRGAVIMANLLDKPSGVNASFHIDKGSEDGLSAGCLALSVKQRSIVGVLDQAGRQVSRVRLLTDAGMSFEVRIQTSRSASLIPAMMVGAGKQRCQIGMIDRQQDVRAGDAVLAAPKPGLLDAPLLVGRICEVKPDPDWPLLWKIAVEPIEDVTKMTQVAVLAPETMPKRR